MFSPLQSPLKWFEHPTSPTQPLPFFQKPHSLFSPPKQKRKLSDQEHLMATNSTLFSSHLPYRSLISRSSPSFISPISIKSNPCCESQKNLSFQSCVRVACSENPSRVTSDEETPIFSPSSAIDFLTLCHRLKTTKRKGWINHGINGPESIADHMYRMALMALIAVDIPGVNRERCIKIAIVHDIAEAIVGDITPSDGVPKQEKSRREQEALDEMCKILGPGLRAEEIKELWAEYENNSSIEASLIKDFDKVEMILQALEYETEHGKVLDEFFLSTAGKFQTEIGRSWAAEVISRRKRLGNGFS